VGGFDIGNSPQKHQKLERDARSLNVVTEDGGVAWFGWVAMRGDDDLTSSTGRWFRAWRKGFKRGFGHGGRWQRHRDPFIGRGTVGGGRSATECASMVGRLREAKGRGGQ
jgi:hypothetical protein